MKDLKTAYIGAVNETDLMFQSALQINRATLSEELTFNGVKYKKVTDKCYISKTDFNRLFTI